MRQPGDFGPIKASTLFLITPHTLNAPYKM